MEFNPMRVRTHYLHTRQRLEAEEKVDRDTETHTPSGSGKRTRFVSEELAESSEKDHLSLEVCLLLL